MVWSISQSLTFAKHLHPHVWRPSNNSWHRHQPLSPAIRWWLRSYLSRKQLQLWIMLCTKPFIIIHLFVASHSNKKAKTLLWFQRSPPWNIILTFYLAFYLTHVLTFYVALHICINSDILSDIPSGILSDQSSGFLSGTFSGISPDNIRHRKINILLFPEILFVWHTSWHSIWHVSRSRRTPQHLELAEGMKAKMRRKRRWRRRSCTFGKMNRPSPGCGTTTNCPRPAQQIVRPFVLHDCDLF